jgi:hypothetical protein
MGSKRPTSRSCFLWSSFPWGPGGNSDLLHIYIRNYILDSLSRMVKENWATASYPFSDGPSDTGFVLLVSNPYVCLCLSFS